MSLALRKTTERMVRHGSVHTAAVRSLASKPESPLTSSSKETMMPWNGWFSSFLEAKLGAERYGKLCDAVLWKPDDPQDFNQIMPPDFKVPLSKDDPSKTIMFRTPSPGSQPTPNLPEGEEHDLSDDPYRIAFYPEDTARRYQSRADPNPETLRAQLELMDENDPRVESLKEQLEAGPLSSPGNKGKFATGPSDFDPTGLRATMSANHEAMNAELDRNMPDHLPTSEWVNREDEIISWFEERDHPIPIGGTGSNYIATHRRIARW